MTSTGHSSVGVNGFALERDMPTGLRLGPPLVSSDIDDTMGARPVLVIDDDLAFCETVTAILTDAGFEVLSTCDGPTGIEMAKASHPAVVLLDMVMAEVDGLVTLACLKEDPALIDIPVVGVTGSPDSTYLTKALLAGAEFFLQKPFGAKSLVKMVKLAGKAAQDERLSRDRRRPPRFRAILPVRCVIGQDEETTREVVGHTATVSVDGLVLLLRQKLSPGTHLRLGLGLPHGEILAEGTVIWQDPQWTGAGRVRHGIRLLDFVGDTGLVQYRRFLRQVAAGRLLRTKS